MPSGSGPIAWFGVYRDPIIFDHCTGKWTGKINISPDNVVNGFYQIDDLELAISQKDYSKKIEIIKNYIAAGDVYQINFTDKYIFKTKGSSIKLYQDLLSYQHVSYASIIKNSYGILLSLSPELFFRIEKNSITTKPMKVPLRMSRRKNDR